MTDYAKPLSVWDGTKWIAVTTTAPEGPPGPPGPKGDKGDTGDTGVVAATAPVTYDAETKTVAFDDAAYAKLTGATFAGQVNVVSPATSGSSGARQIFMDTKNPTATDGKDGDLWVVYTA